jgi:DNA-binding transcriptional ArsR family regulator
MSTGCYAEASPFAELFTDRQRTKILAAFVSERGRDITISYAAQLAGVARSTVYDHIEELENMGVVKETRKMGQSQYYTLNNDNDLAHELYRLEGIALKNREERD